MKKAKKGIITLVVVIAVIWGMNLLLTRFFDNSNTACAGEKFSSVEEAIAAMEADERKENDSSLDYCPPYAVKYAFDYDENTIVFYSYCHDFDGAESDSYAVRILKHNADGTLSFDSGFADFVLREPTGNEEYCYFTNIHTSKGTKSISFIYLPKDSEKDVYIDRKKAEKVLVSIDDNDFYICYAVSHKDTFLSRLFIPVSKRYAIEVR